MITLFLEVMLISAFLDLIHSFRTKATADSHIPKVCISAFINGIFFYYSLSYLIVGVEDNLWIIILAFSLGQSVGSVLGVFSYDKYKYKNGGKNEDAS